MPNRRANLYLLLLLVIGIFLEFISFHAAYYPDTLYGKAVEALYLAYLVVPPIIIWQTKGDRLLRIIGILFWVVCVAVLLYGGYLLEYHDL